MKFMLPPPRRPGALRPAALLAGLALLLACLLPLASCSSGQQLLYSVADGDRTCQVYGKNGRPGRIAVCQGSTQIWETKVKVEKSLGALGGDYGFAVLDLNFDGRNDLKIAVAAAGDQRTERVFLQTEDGSYEESDLFAGLYTLGTNSEEQAVFSFTQSYQHEDAVGDYPESYITTDTTTGYVWKDGTLAPYRRISLTYYSADDIYCLSVSDFNELLGEFLDPDDKWLSRQEYSQTDFSFLYYFR